MSELKYPVKVELSGQFWKVVYTCEDGFNSILTVDNEDGLITLRDRLNELMPPVDGEVDRLKELIITEKKNLFISDLLLSGSNPYLGIGAKIIEDQIAQFKQKHKF